MKKSMFLRQETAVSYTGNYSSPRRELQFPPQGNFNTLIISMFTFYSKKACYGKYQQREQVFSDEILLEPGQRLAYLLLNRLDTNIKLFRDLTVLQTIAPA